MTGKTKVWRVKSTITPDIVRWPAVISSPVLKNETENNTLNWYANKWRGILKSSRILLSYRISIKKVNHQISWLIFFNSLYTVTFKEELQSYDNLFMYFTWLLINGRFYTRGRIIRLDELGQTFVIRL